MENCYHCGDTCRDTTIIHQEKFFCCNGCKTVFDIFKENDLMYYYDIEATPGKTPLNISERFDFLDNNQIVKKLLEFDEQDTQIVSFVVPHIHCSSCIWVLENLNKLHPAIINGQVNFPKKTLRVSYNSSKFNLKDLVLLLCKIGYEPNISLEDFNKKKKRTDRSLIYKLGVAGFAFGNIMFLSFPEYFEVNEFWLDKFKIVFRWLMFAFAIPVVGYAAQDYFVSAYKGLRSRILNIDVPIAIGISVLFLRSAIEVAMDWGTGFFDSMAGLVFFLLLGKFFQQKTYAFLSFERDYKSYFPIAVIKLTKKENEEGYDEQQIPLYELKEGDQILVRNNELIPVDGILIKGTALIDYSFVTGEATPVNKESGDQIYAGGKQQAGIIEVEVSKTVEQSYLTQLWNNDVFNRNKASKFENLTDKISRHFTISILVIAIVAAIYWVFLDVSTAFNVFTAVLIVACPCAIALASPFALGNMLRVFGKQQLYLKEANVIEQMAAIDTVVFDKTGTLTTHNKNFISYQGLSLSDKEQRVLTSTLRASNHPLSRALYNLLQSNGIYTLDRFSEEIGHGITGSFRNTQVKLGSKLFVGGSETNTVATQTQVHVSTNNEYKGCYVFFNNYREGLQALFTQLNKTTTIIILSGDNEGDKNYLKGLFQNTPQLVFNQKPDDKLRFIKELQRQGKKVMMIGDGLNDAGALAQSDVGIAVSEDVNVFSPACDGIISADRLTSLSDFMTLSRKSVRIIKYAFIFSLCYNLVGLGFAITGNLVPVVAAILMPLSSISIVIFTTLSTFLAGSSITNTANNLLKKSIYDV